MSVIYDTANNPISANALSLDSAEVKQLDIRIDCKAPNFLRCEAVADLLVEAKLSTDTTWTNLETTPIALAPYDSTRRTFNVRLTAASVLVFTKRKFLITVRP